MVDFSFDQVLHSWCHDTETLSTLLALCEGNPPVTGRYLSQRPVMQTFDVFFVVCLNKSLDKQLPVNQDAMTLMWLRCDKNSSSLSCRSLDRLFLIMQYHINLSHQPCKRIQTLYYVGPWILDFPSGNAIKHQRPGDHICIGVNSFTPSAAYMCQWIRSAMFQIMACRLCGAKPLSEPMLGYHQMNP